MKRSKFSEEQIMFTIRQAEAGTLVGDLCRQLGASDATFYAWEKYARKLPQNGLPRVLRTLYARFDTASNVSGLTPLRWLCRRVRL